jgi:hypothetical protein
MKTDISLKTKSTKLIQVLLPSVLAGVLTSGCAQIMAIEQPSPFTPTCLKPGVKRMDVIAELGQPVTTENHNNLLADGYKYVDGGSKNSGASKTCRVVLYTAGDFFTIFLDQIIWMPSEKFGFAGTDHSVMIEYVKSDDGVWQAKTIEDKALKGRSTKKEEF